MGRGALQQELGGIRNLDSLHFQKRTDHLFRRTTLNVEWFHHKVTRNRASGAARVLYIKDSVPSILVPVLVV